MYIEVYEVFREHMSQRDYVHTKDHSLKFAAILNLLSTPFHLLGPWDQIQLLYNN